MARKNTRKVTTPKRHTALPPQAKVEAPKVAVNPPVAVACSAGSVVKAAEAKVAAPAIVAKEAAATCAAAAPTTENTMCCKSKLASLVSALANTDADVAREAATGLGALGDASAVAPLIDALKNTAGFYHSVVRAAAASSLGQLGDAKAVQPLLDSISDPIAEVSAEAIRALAVLGDQRAVDALIHVVRNPTGYFLATARRAAVFALGNLGGEKATAELKLVAGNCSEDAVIRTAAEGVKQPATACAHA